MERRRRSDLEQIGSTQQVRGLRNEGPFIRPSPRRSSPFLYLHLLFIWLSYLTLIIFSEFRIFSVRVIMLASYCSNDRCLFALSRNTNSFISSNFIVANSAMHAALNATYFKEEVLPVHTTVHQLDDGMIFFRFSLFFIIFLWRFFSRVLIKK